MTAARALQMGIETLIAPLFHVEPLDWTPPDSGLFDALMLTSANAIRHGGPSLSLYHDLPVFTVGAATTLAAQEQGFTTITTAGPDAPATLDRLAMAGYHRILHLGGKHVRASQHPQLSIHRLAVYHSLATADTRALLTILARAPVILVHSPRAGIRLADLVPQERRAALSLIAISPRACTAAGEGWAQTHTAADPTDSAMLALAQNLCL